MIIKPVPYLSFINISFSKNFNLKLIYGTNNIFEVQASLAEDSINYILFIRKISLVFAK